MRKIIYPLLIAFILLSCTSENTTPDVQTEIIQNALGLKIDRLISPYLDTLRELTDNQAAIAIAVCTPDSILFAKTMGYADFRNKQLADLHTPFHLASVSKPFSALAVLKLIQDSKVKLSDRLINHIPEFENFSAEYREITIEHILTHRSGIPRNIAVDDWLYPSFGANALEENLELLKKHSLDFKPGSSFSYSNSAFDILGIVIERASGMPFHEYLNKEIFTPLGMNHTQFIAPKGNIPSEWAKAHSYGLETQELTPYPYNERLLPSSGVVASIYDMTKWAQLHMGHGTLKNQEIIKPYLFNQALQKRHETPWGDHIGLSWFVQQYLDRPIIMHTGFDTGFESMMYTYLEEDISIIVLANRDFSRSGRIINAVSEIIFDEPIKDYTLSARYKFTEAYKDSGIHYAISQWNRLKADTSDIYSVENDDILTTAAILENGGHWADARSILEFYLTINNQSTYAWRLLGNSFLNLHDTIRARECYETTLRINPQYGKGRDALEGLNEY